jgi:hypothetical protein
MVTWSVGNKEPPTSECRLHSSKGTVKGHASLRCQGHQMEAREYVKMKQISMDASC